MDIQDYPLHTNIYDPFSIPELKSGSVVPGKSRIVFYKKGQLKHGSLDGYSSGRIIGWALDRNILLIENTMGHEVGELISGCTIRNLYEISCDDLRKYDFRILP